MKFLQYAFTVLGLTALAAPAQALVFAINEGVTYRVSNDEVRSRYASIAADLTKALKQPVTIEPVGDYTTLRKGLAEKRFDVAMVHPAHVSIQAIKGSGYKLIAVTKGFQKYTAQFLIRADAPYANLADLKGLKIGAPDEDSITAVMVRATLRDAGITPAAVGLVYTRYQDAVPFFVENNLTKAGATASNAVVKAWQAKGGKVLAASRPVPIKHLIASPSLNAEQVALLQDYFTSLEASEEGRKKLEPTKFTGFERFDEKAMMELGTWLGL